MAVRAQKRDKKARLHLSTGSRLCRHGIHLEFQVILLCRKSCIRKQQSNFFHEISRSPFEQRAYACGAGSNQKFDLELPPFSRLWAAKSARFFTLPVVRISKFGVQWWDSARSSDVRQPTKGEPPPQDKAVRIRRRTKMVP